MTFRVWPVVAIVVALMAVSRDSAACSCGSSGPPCEATWQADAVFAGTVRSIRHINERHEEFPLLSQLVTFDVERAFLGVPPGRVELVTGSGGGDCGYRFEQGKRYVVYAWKRNGGGYTTSICSRTGPLEEADEDIRYLSAIPDPRAGARVYGRVSRYQREPFEDRAVEYGPIEGVVVSLRGDGVARDVVTDENGRYEFPGLATGQLRLLLMVPPEFDRRGSDRQVEIRDLRGCSEHNFALTQVAEASGRVADASGQPVVGVFVDAVAAELAAHRPQPYQSPVKTDEHGWFTFDHLPPGEYVFGVNLTQHWGADKNGPSIFFPGTSDPKQAAIFELKPGDHTDVGVLRLPPR